MGFGNAVQALCDILLRENPLGVRLVAVCTASHGCIAAAPEPAGAALAMADVLQARRAGARLDGLGARVFGSAFELLDACGSGFADVLIEATPLDIARGGEPGVGHVARALELGLHVVTINKGPVAFAHDRLARLAHARGLALRCEGAVLDGAPVFSLVRQALPLARVRGFRGVLNSTTNFILEQLESGAAAGFDEALARAQAAGFAEADASLDVDGWDAAAKVAVLLNVLCGAAVTPHDVRREADVRRIDAAELRAARARGAAIKVVCSGSREAGGAVRLMELDARADALACVRGTSSALTLDTDLAGVITIALSDPLLPQTAYALLADLASLAPLIGRPAAEARAPRESVVE